MGGVRFVDEIGFAFGWIAPEPRFMQRASHAVASDGRVWLIDPVADESALGRACELAEPAGVVQLLDRHDRDCRAVAEQLGVPYYELPEHIPRDAAIGSNASAAHLVLTGEIPYRVQALRVDGAGSSFRTPSSYSLFVLSIQRLRERMPLIVFILLFVLLLMMIGIACACATEHPMKAVDRTLSATSAMPALIEVWTYTFAAMLLAAFVLPQRRRALGRASPQELQRFLF